FFAIVLAAVCCMALSVPALAQGMEPITPYFTHIKSAKGNMTISSSGTAKVTGGMSIAKGDTCEIIATIEQEIDGSWQEVKTLPSPPTGPPQLLVKARRCTRATAIAVYSSSTSTRAERLWKAMKPLPMKSGIDIHRWQEGHWC
ncbi:MAG: hypothetical protein RR528_02615, partial [Angelakisella sp.]